MEERREWVTMPDGVHAVAAQIDWGRIAANPAAEVRRGKRHSA